MTQIRDHTYSRLFSPLRGLGYCLCIFYRDKTCNPFSCTKKINRVLAQTVCKRRLMCMRGLGREATPISSVLVPYVVVLASWPDLNQRRLMVPKTAAAEGRSQKHCPGRGGDLLSELLTRGTHTYCNISPETWFRTSFFRATRPAGQKVPFISGQIVPDISARMFLVFPARVFLIYPARVFLIYPARVFLIYPTRLFLIYPARVFRIYFRPE